MGSLTDAKSTSHGLVQATLMKALSEHDSLRSRRQMQMNGDCCDNILPLDTNHSRNATTLLLLSVL